jgi:3-oxoadipate enol-lactonase
MSASRLDVETIGGGPPLLLLHSLLSDRTSFVRLARLIAGERRSLMVSLPGFGMSPRSEPWIDAYAEQVAELCEELKLPADTDVLGNGLGAFIALKAASRHGERFRRLVLAGCGVAFPEADRTLFRNMAEKAERDGMEGLVEPATRRMLSARFIAANPDAVAERQAAFRAIPADVFAAACRALSTLDLAPELSHIRNPTLVVVGSLDPATPPSLGRDLAGRLPNARMVEMRGIGHAPHLEDPEAFLSVVGPFLGLRGPRKKPAPRAGEGVVSRRETTRER